MADQPIDGSAEQSPILDQHLSYKFQRLRERLRAAISSGELAGKLPGERELAKRFKVNTKTLSKALTELAADGLVERNIGLGTFVRGETPRESLRALLIHDHGRGQGIMAHVDPAAVHLTLLPDSAELPIALINQFQSIIVASDRPSDELIRDLVVRGKRVITIGTRLASFATRAVLIDQASAAALLAQRLVRRGHKQLMLVGYDMDGEIAAAIRRAAPDESVTLRTGQLPDMCEAIAGGVTGLIVTPAIDPKMAIDHCVQSGYSIPDKASVLAIGWADGTPPYSGIFVQATESAAALMMLLEQPATTRPVTVWLTGTYSEGGTLQQPPQGEANAV